MDLTLNTEKSDCWEIVCAQEIVREETSDAVVPDTMPDAALLLSAAGSPLIRSKDVSSGRVRIEANVPVRLLYQPEDGGAPCLIELDIPFSVSPEDERITEDCFCTADIRVSALEARLLNPRKLTVRAELCFKVDCYMRAFEEFPTAPADCAGVETLTREADLSPVVAVTEKTHILTDEYPLPQSLPTIDRILSHQTDILAEELKTVGSKIILRGSARSSLLCMTPDGTPVSVGFSSGFSQIIETEELPEELWIAVTPLLSGAYYESVSDGRAVSVELHLVTQLVVRARRRVRYLADAYSNTRALTLTPLSRTLCAIRREITLRDSLRERIETPSVVSELLSASAAPGSARISGGEVTLPITIRLLCRGTDGALFGVSRTYPFALHAQLREDERLEIVDTLLQELYAAPSAGGVELRLPVELSALVFAEKEESCVAAVSWDESESLDLSDQPTLVLLRATDRDDLWSLARENHSSVAAIEQLNGLSELASPWEKLLLIPKTI